MKRFFPILFVLALLGAACGGDAPPAQSDDGIAALDDTAASPSDAPKAKKKGAANKNAPAGKKNKGKAKGGGVDAGSAGSNYSEGAEGSDGNTGSSGAPATRAAAAIPDGSYAYATQGERNVSGNREEMPGTTTLTAEAPSNGQQTQIRDLRDGDGNGTVTESRLLYRSDGVYLTYVKVTSKFQGGLTDVREFKLPRPELIAPAEAGPGFKRSFTMEGSGTRADVTLEAMGYDKVRVGGSTVRALVVETVIVFSGALEGDQRSVSWFWPKHVMTLKEQVQTDVKNGPIRLQSNYQSSLRQLP